MSDKQKLITSSSNIDEEKECFGWLDDKKGTVDCVDFNLYNEKKKVLNKKTICKTVECLDNVIKDTQLSYENKERIINCLKKVAGDDIFLKETGNNIYPLNDLMEYVFNKENEKDYRHKVKLFLLYMNNINPKKINLLNFRYFNRFFLPKLFIKGYLSEFDKFYNYLPFNSYKSEDLITQYFKYNDIRYTKIFENNRLISYFLGSDDDFIDIIINKIKEKKDNYNIQVLFDDIKYFHFDKADNINKLIRKINLHLDDEYKLKEVQGVSCEDKIIRMLRTVRINRGIDYDINNYFNYIKKNNLEECLLTVNNEKIANEIIFVYYGMSLNLLYDKIEEILDVYERYIKNYGKDKIKEEEFKNKLNDLEKKIIDKVEKYDYKRLDDMDKEDIINFIKNI